MSRNMNDVWLLIYRAYNTEKPSLDYRDEAFIQKKLPDAGKDWRQKEKGAKEDDIVR